MALGRVNRFFANLEWRASLATMAWGSGAVFSAALPAWAVSVMDMFSDYAPLSWVAAGFVGLLAYGLFLALRGYGATRSVRAKYDARFFAESGAVDPLSKVFEGKRIYLNNFVLPSNPIVEGKTFVDCEIVGPANLYLEIDNNINDVKSDAVDAVALNTSRAFSNGFTVKSCTFRNCTFHRITLFIDPSMVQHVLHLRWLNWIAPLPAQDSLNLGEDPLLPLPEGTEGKTPR